MAAIRLASENMLNIKKTVYGFELYRGGPNGSATDRLCTCDNMDKAERMIKWLSALDSLVPLDQVLTSYAEPKPTTAPKTTDPEITRESAV